MWADRCRNLSRPGSDDSGTKRGWQLRGGLGIQSEWRPRMHGRRMSNPSGVRILGVSWAGVGKGGGAGKACTALSRASKNGCWEDMDRGAHTHTHMGPTAEDSQAHGGCALPSQAQGSAVPGWMALPLPSDDEGPFAGPRGQGSWPKSGRGPEACAASGGAAPGGGHVR